MTFEEYVKAINNLFDKYPKLKDAEVYYSSDDEGNNFNSVYFKPSITEMNQNGDVTNSDEKEEGETYQTIIVVN